MLASEGSSREEGCPKNTWEMSFKVQVIIFFVCFSDVVVVNSRLIKGSGSSRRSLGSTSWCGDIFDFLSRKLKLTPGGGKKSAAVP